MTGAKIRVAALVVVSVVLVTLTTVEIVRHSQWGDASAVPASLTTSASVPRGGGFVRAHEFVALTGSDSTATRNGSAVSYATAVTLGNVFASLPGACSKATAGDTVLVEAGTYSATQFLPESVCPDTAPAVTFQCATYADALTATTSMPCNFTGNIFFAATTNLTSSGQPGASYITLSGFETNTVEAQTAWPGHTVETHVNLINNWLTDQWDKVGYALLVSVPNDSVISGNQIGPACCNDWGIEGGINNDGGGINSPIDNVTYIGNYIHDLYDSCNPNNPKGTGGMIQTQYLSACQAAGAVGWGDIGTATTLASNIGASDTTLTVTSPLTNSFPNATHFGMLIGSEYLEVVNDSTATWTIKRAGSCDPGFYCADAASHSAGDTILYPDEGQHHIDGWILGAAENLTITKNRCLNCAVNGDIFIDGGGFIYTADTNGYMCDNITITNNFLGAPSGGTGGQALELGCGATSLGTCVANNDVSGLWGGTTTIAYNTIVGSFAIGSCNDFARSAIVNFIGNISSVLSLKQNFAGSGCQLARANGTLFTPNFSHNLWGDTACNATDTEGTATFVNGSVQTPNLDLSGVQTAINGGEATYCGAGTSVDVDIHGRARPVGAICDIGADEAG